jgi:hypothetical protein
MTTMSDETVKSLNERLKWVELELDDINRFVSKGPMMGTHDMEDLLDRTAAIAQSVEGLDRELIQKGEVEKP